MFFKEFKVKLKLFLYSSMIKFNSKNLRNQMMYKIYKYDLTNKKILIIAPHPDDEVISCGGIISKYYKNIDILCINSSGIKYDWNQESAEEIATLRCKEFYEVSKYAKINKSYIAKIYGIPPMFKGIIDNFNNYLSNFNFNDYDIIFIPYINDAHREHRFVSNYIFPKLLLKQKYKNNLKIAMYEVWSTIPDCNFYEDISNNVDNKIELIKKYSSRTKNRYHERILALNFYRGLVSGYEYAEAFKIIKIKNF